MGKITTWIMRNSLLGALFSGIFGQNWIEEKPALATTIRVFLYIIYFTAFLGFLIAVFN